MPLIIFFTIVNCRCGYKKSPPLKIAEFRFPLKISDSLNYGYNFLTNYAGKINDIDFEPTLINIKNTLNYAFLENTKSKIYTFDLLNPLHVDSLQIPATDSLVSKKLIRINDTNLIIYKPKAGNVFVYGIEDNFISLKRKITLPEIDYSKLYFKTYGFYKILMKPSGIIIIFNYGMLNSPKTGYLDKKSNLLVIEEETGKVLKAGYYPDNFFKSKKYLTGSVFDVDKAGNLYYTYELNDSIFKSDMYGNILTRNALHKNPSFSKFNWSKEKDLAYVRKYSSETEINTSIRVLQNKYVFVLKKLPGKTVLEKPKYKYFLYDNNLRIKYADTLRHGCYAKFISDYKNGFLLLSDSLNKAYYYEIR
jgi:hypothetical protein